MKRRWYLYTCINGKWELTNTGLLSDIRLEESRLKNNGYTVKVLSTPMKVSA